MKLDIEGAEYEVLPWLAQCNAVCGIDEVLVEFHPWMFIGAERDDYVSAMMPFHGRWPRLHRRPLMTQTRTHGARLSKLNLHGTGRMTCERPAFFRVFDDEMYAFDVVRNCSRKRPAN